MKKLNKEKVAKELLAIAKMFEKVAGEKEIFVATHCGNMKSAQRFLSSKDLEYKKDYDFVDSNIQGKAKFVAMTEKAEKVSSEFAKKAGRWSEVKVAGVGLLDKYAEKLVDFLVGKAIGKGEFKKEDSETLRMELEGGVYLICHIFIEDKVQSVVMELHSKAGDDNDWSGSHYDKEETFNATLDVESDGYAIRELVRKFFKEHEGYQRLLEEVLDKRKNKK